MQAKFEHIDDYLAQLAAQKDVIYPALRKQAAVALQEYGFPALKTESWKYTSAKSLLAQVYTPATKAALTTEAIAHLLMPNAEHLIFVNGYYMPQLSNCHSSAKAVILPLSEAYAKHPEKVTQYLGTGLALNQPGFAALNTALFQQGYYIEVAADTKLAKPLQILHIAAQLSAEQAIHQRNLIVLAQSAQATIIEQFVALDDIDYWHNTVSEIFLLANAHLNYYKVQQESSQAKQTAFVTVQQQRDSQFNSFNLDLGGKLVRNDLHTKLMAPGASCNLQGVYLTKDKQHVDNHTEIDHQQAHTYSQEHYKGILTDQSQAVFNGRIVVQANAQKIASEQKNANLLLSNDAEIDTKPELEIYADDVKCAHGTTVGQLDQEAVFYLVSRGITPELARQLLTYGFGYELIEAISDEAVRTFITHLFSSWFADAAALQELVEWA